MDTKYDRDLVEDHLKDTTFYGKISSNIDRHTTKEVNNTATSLPIMKKTTPPISNQNPEASNGLPKIHKSREIRRAVKENYYVQKT